MTNHHSEKTFTIRTSDRIAQCVFMKKYNVQFENVLDMSLLGNTKRGADGLIQLVALQKLSNSKILILKLSLILKIKCKFYQKEKLLLRLIGMN